METTLLSKGTQEGKARLVQTLDELIKKPVILFRAKTKQWFQLFPDEIIIDLHHVTLIHHIFFDSKRVTSIPISQITNSTVTHSLMYGTLSIEVFGDITPPEPIQFLSKKDAIIAEKIIDGLVICSKEGLDLSPYDKDDLVRKLIQLGGGW